MSATEIVGIIMAVLVPVAGGVAWLLKFYSDQKVIQRAHDAAEKKLRREHEEALVERSEKHESEMASANAKVASSFESTIKEMQKDARDEARRTNDSLLIIQKETVKAVHELGLEVRELGVAISEMRMGLDKKVDKT